MNSTEAERMARLIEHRLSGIEPGTLRFWGEWFGRPYDNQHRLVGCDAESDLLHLRFNEGEVLSIHAPRDLHIGPSKLHHRSILLIREADRIRFEWFAYGPPRTAANLYFEEFVKTADGVQATTNVDWYMPNLKPRATEPAVEIR